MTEGAAGAIALVSIRPVFANAILDGAKRVEFRKVGFKRDVTHVILYATSPIQQIIGWVEVSGIDRRSPAALWRRYHLVAGIERIAFFDYYKGKSFGFAIKVRRPQRLLRPLALDELEHSTPPQSFLYSTPDAFRRVRQGAVAA